MLTYSKHHFQCKRISLRTKAAPRLQISFSLLNLQTNLTLYRTLTHGLAKGYITQQFSHGNILVDYGTCIYMDRSWPIFTVQIWKVQVTRYKRLQTVDRHRQHRQQWINVNNLCDNMIKLMWQWHKCSHFMCVEHLQRWEQPTFLADNIPAGETGL